MQGEEQYPPMGYSSSPWMGFYMQKPIGGVRVRGGKIWVDLLRVFVIQRSWDSIKRHPRQLPQDCHQFGCPGSVLIRNFGMNFINCERSPVNQHVDPLDNHRFW